MPSEISTEGKQQRNEVSLSHDGEGTWFFEFSEEMRNVQVTLYDIGISIRASPSRAESNLDSIIERHPYAFDAYDRLAYILYYMRGQRKETLDLLEKGLANAKQLFPRDFTFGKSSLPWGIIENRPFFRMYKTLGVVLKEGGEIERGVPRHRRNEPGRQPRHEGTALFMLLSAWGQPVCARALQKV